MEVQNSPDARPRGFFRRHSRKLFAIVAFLTMVAASPFLVFFGSTVVDALKERSNRLSFDAAVWKASLSTSAPSDPIRLRMVDDLFRRHKLAGLTVEQVVALLGTPPKTEYFQDCQFVY